MLNHIAIMGRLTREPESGVSVASFTVAVDRDYTQNGERGVDFIDCVSWREGAEFVCKYFHKGSMIVVSGRLQSRKWQDRDGNNRTNWEIIADHTYFGEAKRQEQGNGFRPAGDAVNVAPPEESGASQHSIFSDINDDGELPF